LLDWLAVNLVQNGYDLKRTMNLLLTSKAYQRPSVPLDPDIDADEYVFKGPVVRRLSAEQFLDGLEQVILAAGAETGWPAERGTGKQRAGLRKIDHLMRTLGRTKRDVVVTQRESTATTAQLIELSNGRALAGMLTRGGKAWVDSGLDSGPMIDSLFSNAVGRRPSGSEKRSAQEIIGSPATAQGLEDLLWMLAMHPDFQLIH
ncbi:MAG: DUF1553 domain-containing protein, partial [Verrucomicrobiota bacterium]